MHLSNKSDPVANISKSKIRESVLICTHNYPANLVSFPLFLNDLGLCSYSINSSAAGIIKCYTDNTGDAAA